MAEHLTKIGVAHALKRAAFLADGRTDPDAVLEWAIATGMLVPDPQTRGQVVLTYRGAQLVHAYWKGIEEGLAERRQSREGRIVMPGEQAA